MGRHGGGVDDLAINDIDSPFRVMRLKKLPSGFPEVVRLKHRIMLTVESPQFKGILPSLLCQSIYL
jgi:hypothetical protein